jgi:hypothetical protein
MGNEAGLIKTIASKIGLGFLTGIGFSLAMVLILYVLSGLVVGKMMEDSMSEAEESFGYKQFGPDSGLEIISHEEKKSENNIVILGQLKNSSDKKWSSVGIEAELFDENKKFLDECNEYISYTIGPDEIENFKISCGGCDNTPVPKHASYTIRIVSAYQVR